MRLAAQIGYLPVHWHALFDAVMGKGGYEKVCIARRGEWAHIARQLYGKTFQEHFGGLLRVSVLTRSGHTRRGCLTQSGVGVRGCEQKHYKEVLLKYELQVRDEQDTQMIMPDMDEEDEERMSREPFGQLLREGGVPMEVRTPLYRMLEVQRGPDSLSARPCGLRSTAPPPATSP